MSDKYDKKFDPRAPEDPLIKAKTAEVVATELSARIKKDPSRGIKIAIDLEALANGKKSPTPPQN